MKNLKFKYFSAKNFMCFGPEGVEIDVEKLGDIVLIRGENLDIIDEEEKEGEERIASNGIGKSTIPEIIIYTFFGETIKRHKKINHENIINNKIGTDLRTEVRWDDYRVVRTRARNKNGSTSGTLRMWKSTEGIWDKTTDMTLGSMGDTEKLIARTLGFNYQTCLNLLVFADQSYNSFLECDGPKKREVVEDLMSLQIFREYNEEAKNSKNALKTQLKLLIAAYEASLNELKSAKDRIERVKKEELDWLKERKAELENLRTSHAKKKAVLGNSDIGPALAAYEVAQSKIKQLTDEIPELEKQLTKAREAVHLGEEKVESRKQEKSELDQQILDLQNKNLLANNEIKSKEKVLVVKNRKGQRCGECYGVVDEANYSAFTDNAQKSITENQNLIKNNDALISELNTQRDDIKTKITNGNNFIARGQLGERQTNTLIDNARKEIQKLTAIQKPIANDQDKVLLTEIADIEKQIDDKKQQIDGPTPYVGLFASAEKDAEIKERESENKKQALNTVENDLPYYEWWADGFSPKGIPKFAINDIIPALNGQIAHWLEFLIDGKIKLTFNNELEEMIERNPSDGDPFVYYAMSGGEKRRLNLAVSQAFAYIMTHSSKASPSLVFLDEVTTNIDPMGVVGVYNMILELAKEKQVFITTHDQGLLELLQGCETLYLRKKGGFSKLVNNS
jgi:DNA repair exonuclease SbcCD ATPase subunit